jgi:hypothetical protein
MDVSAVRHRIEVRFTTTYLISASCEVKPRSCEVYSMQYHVIKFVRDLVQVGGFLRVFWLPPPIKLTATI